MRRHLTTLLKLAVTAVGLTLALRAVDLRALLVQLRSADAGWLALALALMVASLVVRAGRWGVLLAGLGARVPLRRLVALYFIGNFFNSFLPSGFGGDAVRVVEAAHDVPASVAAGTVVVDRLTGLLMLFAMALAGLPLRPSTFPPDLLRAVVALCAGGLAAGGVLLFGRFLQTPLTWLAARRPGGIVAKGVGALGNVLAAVQGCGRPALARALAVSLLFNLMLVGWWAAVGAALRLDVSFGYYLLVVPVLSVALLVPSIGGLGVNEWLAPLLFAGAGVAPEAAVALSLLQFVLLRLSSLLGAPVYLLR